LHYDLIAASQSIEWIKRVYCRSKRYLMEAVSVSPVVLWTTLEPLHCQCLFLADVVEPQPTVDERLETRDSLGWTAHKVKLGPFRSVNSCVEPFSYCIMNSLSVGIRPTDLAISVRPQRPRELGPQVNGPAVVIGLCACSYVLLLKGETMQACFIIHAQARSEKPASGYPPPMFECAPVNHRCSTCYCSGRSQRRPGSSGGRRIGLLCPNYRLVHSSVLIDAERSVGILDKAIQLGIMKVRPEPADNR
jgi:hypothetical protein